MEEMIAVCGLICSECPAFMATRENDDTARAMIAASWSAGKEKLRAADIDCNGCLSAEGPLFKFCETCEVRKCGLEKNVRNCAYCDEYSCAKLDKLLRHMQAADARATLEKIRKDLQA
jgi:hypothetical protein